MSEIYFIRHGQASFGEKNYDRLSPIGVRQAEITADHVARLNMEFDAIYSGRMKRQRDTALSFSERHRKLLPEGDGIRSLPAFDEYDAKRLLWARKQAARNDERSAGIHGPPGQDKKRFQAYFSQTVNRWLAGDYDNQEGVESWASFCGRVHEGIHHLMETHGRGRRIAVITSGGPISIVVQTVLELSPRKTVEISWQLMNASITSIKYHSSRLSLSGFNNVTALLLEKDPALLTYR